MKYLNKILEANEISENMRQSASGDYLAAKERMKSLPLTFSDDAELMLSNHLMALIKRISEKKFVDPIEEEMMSELSEKAWEYARRLVGPLFSQAGIPEDKSEVFLVGTHMEMAIASQE